MKPLLMSEEDVVAQLQQAFFNTIDEMHPEADYLGSFDGEARVEFDKACAKAVRGWLSAYGAHQHLDAMSITLIEDALRGRIHPDSNAEISYREEAGCIDLFIDVDDITYDTAIRFPGLDELNAKSSAIAAHINRIKESVPPKKITSPLSKDELVKIADRDGYITVLVDISLGTLINADIDWLNEQMDKRILSDGCVGSLSDLSYTVDSSSGDIITIKVHAAIDDENFDKEQ